MLINRSTFLRQLDSAYAPIQDMYIQLILQCFDSIVNPSCEIFKLSAASNRKELAGDGVEFIKASRNNSYVTVDITLQESIQAMFEQVGPVDALISTLGSAHFGPVAEMTPEQNQVAVDSKIF